MSKKSQLKLFSGMKTAYGGELLKTRKGRQGPRPLATRNSMHLVLRSTKARGPWSFRSPRNAAKIKAIIRKFSERYGVRIHSMANAGNHLHLHVQFASRYTYRPFIRAVTSAIAMTITGWSRWRKAPQSVRFWDARPFSRVVQGFGDFLRLKNYVKINQVEGLDFSRDQARLLISLGAENLLLSG